MVMLFEALSVVNARIFGRIPKSLHTCKNVEAKFSPLWQPLRGETSNVSFRLFQFSSIQWTVIPRKACIFDEVQASIANDNRPGESFSSFITLAFSESYRLNTSRLIVSAERTSASELRSLTKRQNALFSTSVNG